MSRPIIVEGFEALKAFINGTSGKGKLFVYFVSGFDESGQSWCGDCRDAEPAVSEAIGAAPDDVTIVKAVVGEKTFWKDQSNPFRTEMGVTNIPTLMNWQTKKVLIEGECTAVDNVKAFFCL